MVNVLDINDPSILREELHKKDLIILELNKQIEAYKTFSKNVVDYSAARNAKDLLNLQILDTIKQLNDLEFQIGLIKKNLEILKNKNIG